MLIFLGLWFGNRFLIQYLTTDSRVLVTINNNQVIERILDVLTKPEVLLKLLYPMFIYIMFTVFIFGILPIICSVVQYKELNEVLHKFDEEQAANKNK